MDGTIHRISPFADGAYEYDSHQQAWRLLGFMIDCDDQYLSSSSNNCDDGNNNRKGSGSGDGGTGEGCHRYVIWAAVCVCVGWRSWSETRKRPPHTRHSFLFICLFILGLFNHFLLMFSTSTWNMRVVAWRVRGTTKNRFEGGTNEAVPSRRSGISRDSHLIVLFCFYVSFFVFGELFSCARSSGIAARNSGMTSHARMGVAITTKIKTITTTKITTRMTGRRDVRKWTAVWTIHILPCWGSM
jgi:hypothetical protein